MRSCHFCGGLGEDTAPTAVFTGHRNIYVCDRPDCEEALEEYLEELDAQEDADYDADIAEVNARYGRGY